MNIDNQAALDFVNEMERVQIAGYPPTSRDYDELRRILTTPRAPALPNYGAVRSPDNNWHVFCMALCPLPGHQGTFCDWRGKRSGETRDKVTVKPCPKCHGPVSAAR